MKKIIALLLALLMVVCMFACSEDEKTDTSNSGSAVSDNVITVKSGKFECEVNNEGDFEIVNYKPYDVNVDVDLTLPGKISGREIAGIAANAFEEAKLTIKSVTIPESYTYISDGAFNGCTDLETVKMTNKMTHIGKGAFQDCVNLTKITGTAGIKYVGKQAFDGCSSLKEIDLSACETIEFQAFFECDALTNVTISEKINYLSMYAFYGLKSLKYNVYDEVNYLGNKNNPYIALVCPQDKNIVTCVVNDKTKLIADCAFAYCQYLDTVTLGKAVTIVDGNCFENDPKADVYLDKNTDLETIPTVDLRFDDNSYETGRYLGTANNKYKLLLYVEVTASSDFTLHKDTEMIADSAFANSKIKDIYFEGTEAEWEAIQKSEDWNHGRSINVICSDSKRH